MRIPTFSQFSMHLDSINDQMTLLGQLNLQGSSGKKIQNSSEDPTLANEIKSTENFIQSLHGYDDNLVIAQNRAELHEKTLHDSIDIINKVRTLLQAAQAGTLSAQARADYATQLQGNLTNLLRIANTQDANGQYIYSGTNVNTQPYVLSSGSYQYQGSLTTSNIDIGPNANQLFNESGFNVYGKIKTGNGTFTVTAGNNTGTAITSAGSVTSGYVADTYTITFVTNGSGQLAYQVVGATSGQVIPAPPAVTPTSAPVYVPGSDITFNGAKVNVTGAPAVGDTLVVAPSQNQDVFDSIQNLINTLGMSVTNDAGRAQLTQALGQASATFTQVFDHLNSYMGSIGVRSGSIITQADINKKLITAQDKTKIALEGVDAPAVISAIKQQSLVLQVTQECFIKLQETLTNLLKYL